MSAHPGSRLQWLSWGAAALAGVLAAYGASTVAAWARASCGASGAPHRLAPDAELLLVSAAAAGIAVSAVALARWATVRGPRSTRASAQVAVVLLAVAALAWWYLSAHASPSGSGLCPAGGAPAWWPAWLPR
ncbi:hypothetical protein ACGFMM_26925 [Streptomyces sp. NPDC048604]|uniref:hypothetical protein n=1 Tax=Streptomyces sp. NPDC048604 TaxID=3365578 RepID=UPI003710F5E9